MKQFINDDTQLFLFNFQTRTLIGTFSALSAAEQDIKPDAFNGKFSAQVSVVPMDQPLLSDGQPLLAAFGDGHTMPTHIKPNETFSNDHFDREFEFAESTPKSTISPRALAYSSIFDIVHIGGFRRCLHRRTSGDTKPPLRPKDKPAQSDTERNKKWILH